MENRDPYPFGEIEVKWRKKWEDQGQHIVDDDDPRPKYYCLDMFPYPSASGLHVGHWRGYVISDMWSRYMLLNGYNVLHPMGWDSFGLPAENDAISKNIHPKVNTEKNIANYKRQLREISAVYDWSREISTSDPAYYRWTQWIFLKMYEKGLAYRAKSPINWCPDCKTGLANEEVIDGTCERCGAHVTKKDMVQWMLRITEYADRLLEGLMTLEWPEKVKTMQTNWIGRSEGAEVIFSVRKGEREWKIPVFTTRPDTLFGATYLVLAPEHALSRELCEHGRLDDLGRYIERTRCMTEIERKNIQREKTGVPLGVEAINPAGGAKIPVWVSDYVLTTYGTGAIMAVPAHDDRDYEFAVKFGLPIIEVIYNDRAERNEAGDLTAAYTGEGRMINSGPYDGIDSKTGRSRITRWLEERSLGGPKVSYRLRDWIYSRQRYWGEPIPIVYCDSCGEVPVPEEDLPVTLPDVESYKPTGTGESPLAGIEEWVNTLCPGCGGPARRETDTMPQWAGSSWYFLRYPSPNHTEGPFDAEKVRQWLPVDSYFGGVEHAILHLLYARFFTMFLYDIGLIDFEEPFQRLFNQGMINYRAYRCPRHGYVPLVDIEEGDCPKCGEELQAEFCKMSKSKGNVVSPDGLVERYGTDTLRMYELFTGPPEQDSEWSDRGIEGIYRFLRRLWSWFEKARELAGDETDPEVRREYHILLKDVTRRIEDLRLNTAISRLMEFLNFLTAGSNGDRAVGREVLEGLARLIAPMAPHLGEEMWERLGHDTTVFRSTWPVYDKSLAERDVITIAVQVDGKLRGTMTVERGIGEDRARQEAERLESVSRHLEGKEIRRVIFIPDRILNFIVGK